MTQMFNFNFFGVLDFVPSTNFFDRYRNTKRFINLAEFINQEFGNAVEISSKWQICNDNTGCRSTVQVRTRSFLKETTKMTSTLPAGKLLYSFSFLCVHLVWGAQSLVEWNKGRNERSFFSAYWGQECSTCYISGIGSGPQSPGPTACIIINHSSGRNRGKDLSLKPNHLGSHSGTSKQKGWWLEQGTYLLRLSFLTYKMCKESQVLFRRTVMGILKALESACPSYTM